MLFLEPFRRPRVQAVEHVALEKFLVRNSHFDWVLWGAVLLEPRVNQWYVDRAACVTRAHVEWSGCPIERDR